MFCVVCVVSVSVWVQVQDSNHTNIGDVDEIDIFPTNISKLRKAVKTQWSQALAHTDTSALSVYANDGEQPLAAGATVPTSFTSTNPLIVVVPAKEAQGKALLPNNPTLHWR